jgi:hypothetical protein
MSRSITDRQSQGALHAGFRLSLAILATAVIAPPRGGRVQCYVIVDRANEVTYQGPVPPST